MEAYLGSEMDFEYLKTAGIIEYHYPLHNADIIERI